MELFLLPIPAAGHLTSTMEMASRLLDRVGGGGLSVTVLVMTTPAPCLRFETESCIRSLSSIGAGVRFEELPVLPPAQFFEECDQVGASCSRYVELHKPRLKTAILRLRSSPAAALVIDFFATTMIDVADELGIPAYHYFTSSAATLALLLHAPTLHDKKKLPVVLDGDEAAFIELPGMSPTPARRMPSFVMSSRRETYEWFQVPLPRQAVSRNQVYDLEYLLRARAIDTGSSSRWSLRTRSSDSSDLHGRTSAWTSSFTTR